jgi:ribosome recycling factor
MLDKIVQETKPKMQEVTDHLKEELKGISTGRASTGLVDDILVSYYGNMTPMRQVASITTPDANLVVIQPWERGLLGDIEMAIRNSSLSLNPINDGQVVRIALPPLTEERRKEFVKTVNQKAEAARISLRNIRKEAWEKVQSAVKSGELTEDDKYRGEDRLNKLIDKFNQKIEIIAKDKEKDIMTI